MNKNFRKQRLVAEINITPFTDVILVLLVIFMIATPLIYQSSIKVRLPEAKSGKPIESSKPDLVYITVTNEGLLYLNEEIITRGKLKEKIRAIQLKNPDLGVVLRSDRLVRFKDIVDILDPLSDLGITKLDIATINQ